MDAQTAVEANLASVIPVGYSVEITVFSDHVDGAVTPQDLVTWARSTSGDGDTYQVYGQRLSKRNVYYVHRLK